ncbi:MAG TPA: sugar ABC transporter substrate-binding protein [Chloroflexota bacterium]|nr:sugar ABC transporter substrate-binding protein [Chloroflexota bacterium]
MADGREPVGNRGAGSRTRRRVLGAAGVAWAAVQAACGPQGGAAPASPATTPVQLSFAAHGDASWQEFWNTVVARFNQAHSPKITAQFFSSDPDGFKKYVVLMASGEMWDVFRNEEKRMPEFAANGTLKDITALAQRDRDTKKEDFPESIWNEFFWGGKQFGFGHDLSPAVIFYNRALFKEHGLALPPTRWGDPSWTPEKFLEVSKRLTTADGPQKVWAFAGNTWWVYQHPWVWGNGGTIVSKDDKTVTLDDPKTMEMLQWYADLGLVQRISPTSAELSTLGGDQKAFQAGRVAMYVNNTSFTITMRQFTQQNPNFDWDMAPYPTGRAGAFTRVPNNIVTSWVGTKQPEASWTFMRFMASKEATWDARGMPSRLSVAALPEVLSRTPHQNWRLLADAGQVRKSEPRTPYFTDFDSNTLNPAWVEVLEGKRTVREMISDVKPKLQAILDGKGAR